MLVHTLKSCTDLHNLLYCRRSLIMWVYEAQYDDKADQNESVDLTRTVPSSLPLHMNCGPRRVMSQLLTNVWWPFNFLSRVPTSTSHIATVLSVDADISRLNNINTRTKTLDSRAIRVRGFDIFFTIIPPKMRCGCIMGSLEVSQKRKGKFVRLKFCNNWLSIHCFVQCLHFLDGGRVGANPIKNILLLAFFTFIYSQSLSPFDALAVLIMHSKTFFMYNTSQV